MAYSKELWRMAKDKNLQNSVDNYSETWNSGGFSGGSSKANNLAIKADNIEHMDMETLNSDYVSFAGCCTDGRYIYYVIPGSDRPYIVRHDTNADFTTANISAVDTTNGGASPTQAAYESCCFDGRYIYLIPFSHDTYGQHGVWGRYDTTQSFTYVNFEWFDMGTVSTTYRGFLACAFDGRYLYLAPFVQSGGTPHGYLVRYDTTQSFSSSGSYSVFDTTTLNAQALGFFSCAINSTHLFMVSFSGTTGTVVKYDLSQSFTSSGSYETYDLTNVNANLKTFRGCVCTNDNLYILPAATDETPGTPAYFIKCDLSKDFDNADSWSFKDIALENSQYNRFHGSVILGTDLYLIPYNSTRGEIVVYDTLKDIDDTTSRTEFDLNTIDAAYEGYWGACYLNGYIYLSPYYRDVATVYTPSGNALKIKVNI